VKSRFIISQKLKGIIECACAVLYSVFVLKFQEKPRRIILDYHGVGNGSVNLFEKQMKYLAENYNVEVVKPSEILTFTTNKDIVASITFDDAFVSVKRNAVPILKKYNFTAGIFVPTGSLNTKPKWFIPDNSPERDEVVMDREQIAELAREGFEIFSHTVSHPKLTEIGDDGLEYEHSNSKKMLEEIVGREVCAISYPNGVFNEKVIKVAKKTGYKMGFTIEPVLADHFRDKMQIGRFVVSANDNLRKFKLIIMGAYQVSRYLRMIKHLFAKERGKKAHVIPSKN